MINQSTNQLWFEKSGPAFNNQITGNNKFQQEQQHQQQQKGIYMSGEFKKTQATELLEKWCFASQMSQGELTQSFKKLVQIVKSQPGDENTEQAVMSGAICQGALVQKNEKSGETVAKTETDAQAHELIKDVYMDALIACESRECMQQLLRIIESEQVDPIRASYYMTRVAVGSDISSKSWGIKDQEQVKQLAMNFIKNAEKQMWSSEIVERQQLLAVTGTLDKVLKQKQINEENFEKKQGDEMVEIAKQVAKLIVERYIKPVSQQEVRQYQEQPAEQQSEQLVKKIAKRSAALKALANLPAWILKQQPACEQVIVEIVENKDELSTVRQSAIECLEENDKSTDLLKKITFDQNEPTEVRVAAYRALMTTFNTSTEEKNNKQEQQEQEQIIAELIKHCEQQQNQQEDEQFVLYVISHLNNVRQSQQPEVAAIKETLEQNKQWLMQVQILCQKFKQQLEQVRKFSRNYKLEQQFNQLESGLIIEGDLVYESESKKQNQQSIEILPKVVRVNVSMPVMGETVNVIELTLRQQNMDEQLLSTLKLVQSAKFNGPESMNKVVESFKNAAEKQQQQQQQNQYNTKKQGQQQQQEQVEADLCIKVDGQTVVFVTLDDVKCDQHTTTANKQHQQQRDWQTGNKRQTRSIFGQQYYQEQHQSIVEAIVEHLKRQPIAFNRGINFNLNQRFAKLLDIEASLIAGLRFESRAQQHSQDEYEILVRAEPRVAFESIVGPAKSMSSKKLLNRASTKSALGLRLRYKQNELVDFELELPMEKMELFNFEQQLVKASSHSQQQQQNQYQQQQFNYLEDSIYGEQDIYNVDDEDIFGNEQEIATARGGIRRMMNKRSIFGSEERFSTLKSLRNLMTGNKRSFAQTYESSEQLARLTGLRSAVRVVVAPKEFGYRVACVAQKVDPAMRSIRFQLVNKSETRSNQEQKQYQLIVSTPGARTDRTIQVRVQQQLTAQRSLIKAIVESPMMTLGAQLELIHDGRQYAAKVECNGQRQKHTAEWGFQRGQQSTSGRIAATYKPYFQINSTELKRPIQMQAIVSCQWEPKTVITYELKSMTSSANFVQGKITIDAKSMDRHYTTGNKRRSMESPIVRMLTQDMTLVAELVAQIENHLVKCHHMTQWEPTKFALQSDFTMQHKNSRKTSEDKTVSGLLKIDELKQQVQLECKYPQESRKDWRMQVIGECKPGQHQLVAELRYKQNLSQIVAYKHKLQIASGKPTQWNKFDLVSELEFVASEWNVQEKLAGRTHVIWERQQKQVECELKSNDNKLVKISMDSNKQLEQHKCELLVKVDRFGQHQTILRSDKNTLLSLQSRTDCFRRNMMVQKTEIDIVKPTYASKQSQYDVMPSECRVHVQMPTKQLNVLVDAKLESGKPSSWIVESPVFVSRGEFSFEKLARQTRSVMPHLFRFKSEARDLISKDAYWVESHLARDEPSFVRANSPIYAAEMTFEPKFESTKMNLFARNKRSIDQFDEIYSTKAFHGQHDQTKPLELANKLWAIRSIINRLPAQQKKNILSAVFEFLGREASHKHSFEWNPVEKRASFDLSAQNDNKLHRDSWSPMRATGRLEGRFERPSALELDANQWGKFELEAKPFDGETGFAKMNAHSRHPRSAYKKHESEIRYEREHGLRGQLKHEDRDSKMHSVSLVADRQPQKWAKIQMDSDKHGKGQWEHKWRHESSQVKRQHSKRSIDQELFFDNQINAEWESPRSEMSQRHQINWQEPIAWTSTGSQRNNQQSKYNNINEYIKNVNARVSSQYNKQQKPIYELNFDYKPETFDEQQQQQQNIARFNMRLANEWDHKTNFDFIPQEQSYKLSSRSHVDSPAREQIYDFSAQTRAQRTPFGLATEQQEPLFFNDKHAAIDEQNTIARGFSTLFKQPLKLDYTDKFGRAARFDYDHSPVTATGHKFAGLRQKRAAFYYKDQNQDLEHQTSLDFYPEELIAGQWNTNNKQSWNTKQQKQQTVFQTEKPGQMTLKTQTKYGPVVAQIDSDETTCEVKLSSPIVNVKLTGETATKRVGGAKLYKLDIDNKQQKMSVEKYLRQLPVVGKCQIVKEVAKNFDQARFEHSSELLVSFVESIIKLKSETRNESRPVMNIEAEWNKPAEKFIVKVDGKRCCDAQLIVDLVTKSTQFSLKSNDKHQINHQTRIVKLNDKFYSVESMTTYKQKPIFKFNGKLSALLLEKPYHVFQHGLRNQQQFGSERLSTFEATIFEPKPYEIKGEFDCLAMEARVQCRNVYEHRVQTSVWKFEPASETLFVSGKLIEENEKPVYSFVSKINFPGLFESRHCHSQACQSELVYKNEQDSRQQWAVKLVPGEYIDVLTPSGKQTVNWVF